MEDAEKLPLPGAFLDFLKENGLDPSIYTAIDSIPRYIRLKPGCEAYIEEVQAEMKCKLQKVDWLAGFYSIPPDIQIASSKAYQEGKIYGIDASSGAAVMALNISEGDHVLDLCAAPGAKLCMILDLLGNSGSLTGVDVARHRLAACRTMLQKYTLGDRCRLFVADGTTFSLVPAGFHSACNSYQLEEKVDVFKEWTSRRPWKERQKAKKGGPPLLASRSQPPELIYYGQHSGVVGLTKGELYKTLSENEIGSCGYDKVLVDAECTHDGSFKHIQKFEHWGWKTLQRRVLDAERTDSLHVLQLDLLTNGFRLLKVGGTLVYSTCSLTFAQNEDVVDQFLKENRSAELQDIESARGWPCKNGRILKTLRFDPLTSSAGKWLGFVTAIWVQAICGNNYTFANYSDALKILMGLTQTQLNNLSVAKDVGKAFGIFSGLASDCWSTSTILIIGAIEGLIGYGVQLLVVSQRISPIPYWLMCVFLCLGGNSSTWLNTAVLVTCLRNFPKNRGPVSGILKGYVGLSTAIFTDICTALFSSDPSTFLLMLAIVPAVICFIAVLFLRESPPASTFAEEKQETQFFNIFNIVAITVAVYLLAFDITGRHGHVLSLVFTAGLLILLASPLLVPLYSIFFQSNPNPDMEQQIKEPLLGQNGSLQTEEEQQNLPASSGIKVEEVERKRKPLIGEDHNILEMLKTLDFWVLFVSFLCGVGTGLCVMNNMGQIGLALGYSDVSIFISFISIWGFFGRIFSGSLSEYFIRKSAMPRPLWNAASQILMCLGYVAMAMALPGSLYIGSMIVGICYGVRFAVTVPIASELFGLKYFGLLYNIIILNLPLGSFIFSGLIAGFLYDAQATSVPGGGNVCIGPNCYMLVFVIMAITCVLGCGLDLFLALRTKNVYSKIQLEKSLVTSTP
ncbi:hypothetical protein L6164_020168 [Bauhinia variegata]|uniref:Uncharacterized protein n=1 Tax=Bauhinia variegata TaxID=167791 RepID=A0ACB9MUK7_BAUVA|nr:hypothetical protein L6164_020168 [Bauhinia variegata]